MSFEIRWKSSKAIQIASKFMHNNVKIIHFSYDLTELHYGSAYQIHELGKVDTDKSLMYMNIVKIM